MADKIICPGCDKESYTAAPYAYLPCPHCGLSFSVQGIDKRKHPRIHREVAFHLNLGRESIAARTMDISRGGIGVKIIGLHNISAGNIMDIYIPELGIASKAEIVWHKIYQEEKGGETHIGIKFIQPTL